MPPTNRASCQPLSTRRSRRHSSGAHAGTISTLEVISILFFNDL
jgi:hypothetical protein